MLLTASLSKPFNLQTLSLYSANGWFSLGKTWHKTKHCSCKSFKSISTNARIDKATKSGAACSSHKSFEPMSRITTLGAVPRMACKSNFISLSTVLPPIPIVLTLHVPSTPKVGQYKPPTWFRSMNLVILRTKEWPTNKAHGSGMPAIESPRTS